jgi:hypothetical protein
MLSLPVELPQTSPSLIFDAIFQEEKMKLKLTATAALFAIILPFAAHADTPGDHPGYLHALSDLRAARWNLEHRPGDLAITVQEELAISEVDRAVGEVKKAALEDAKNLANKPYEDAALDRPGRLHHAVELLEKAHDDLDREEDNPAARGLKHRAMEHVDRAIEAARHAIRDVELHR